MVATYTAEHITARMNIRTVIHNPADAATAQLVDLALPKTGATQCLPLTGFRRFFASITTSILGGTGPTAFSIYAATSAAGAGGVAVVTHAMGSLPNAVNDCVILECDIAQVREVLATATHIGVWVDCNHNDDEVACTFIRFDAENEYADLTDDYVS
jgi:hypothetical protein